MPRITARQHRKNVSAELAAIKEAHRAINDRLDGMANQITGLATAARVAVVLDQLAALGTHASEDHDEALARLATIGTQVDAVATSMQHWAAAAQAAVTQPPPAAAEPPVPAAEGKPAASRPPRRRAAGAK